MDIEREIKVRDAIKYCIENFDSKTATNRIVEFWKDELELQKQQFDIANVVWRSEQLANFCKKISKQEDCPAEFQEIVNKEFWNLID